MAFVVAHHSACHGEHDPDALDRLVEGGYDWLKSMYFTPSPFPFPFPLLTPSIPTLTSYLPHSPFENGDLRLSFHQRRHLNRARLLVETFESGKLRKLCLHSLTGLAVFRGGSFLKFRTRGREGLLWCAARFRSWEGGFVDFFLLLFTWVGVHGRTVLILWMGRTDLVILFSSFIALRSHDAARPVEDFDDHNIHHEDRVFSGWVSLSFHSTVSFPGRGW